MKQGENLGKDYYTFGMIMWGRNVMSSEDYRFGFNGQEKINEIKGNGNYLDFKFRGYDSRFGRFFSVDPLSKEFPSNSSYAFAENDVIRAIDIEGLEKYYVNRYYDKQNKLVSSTINVLTNAEGIVNRNITHQGINRSDQTVIYRNIYTKQNKQDIYSFSDKLTKPETDALKNLTAIKSGSLWEVPEGSGNFIDNATLYSANINVSILPPLVLGRAIPQFRNYGVDLSTGDLNVPLTNPSSFVNQTIERLKNTKGITSINVSFILSVGYVGASNLPNPNGLNVNQAINQGIQNMANLFRSALKSNGLSYINVNTNPAQETTDPNTPKGFSVIPQ